MEHNTIHQDHGRPKLCFNIYILSRNVDHFLYSRTQLSLEKFSSFRSEKPHKFIIHSIFTDHVKEYKSFIFPCISF